MLRDALWLVQRTCAAICWLSSIANGYDVTIQSWKTMMEIRCVLTSYSTRPEVFHYSIAVCRVRKILFLFSSVCVRHVEYIEKSRCDDTHVDVVALSVKVYNANRIILSPVGRFFVHRLVDGGPHAAVRCWPLQTRSSRDATPKPLFIWCTSNKCISNF